MNAIALIGWPEIIAMLIILVVITVPLVLAVLIALRIARKREALPPPAPKTERGG
jgi:hypothetical protein